MEGLFPSPHAGRAVLPVHENTFPYSAFMVFIPVMGVIIAIEVLSRAMCLGYFGKMADRYKRSHMIVIGMIMVSFGTLALVYVHLLAAIALFALLIGGGNAMAIAAATAVVAIDGRTLGQGWQWGPSNTVMSIGIVVPPLIFGVMVTAWEIDSIYIFAGVISLLTLLPFWGMVLRSRRLVPPPGTEEIKNHPGGERQVNETGNR